MPAAQDDVVVRFAPGLRPVLKHGSHNQKDHAGKKSGVELTDDQIRDVMRSHDTAPEMFSAIAAMQGKSMAPKIGNVSEPNMYRGLADRAKDVDRLVEGQVSTVFTGTWGDGLYVTPLKEEATFYGGVVGMKLDSKARILRGEAEWARAPVGEWDANGQFRSDFIDINDVPNLTVASMKNVYWAGKGYDGFQPFSREAVLFNGEHLTLNRNDLAPVQKHGRHDQSSHGRRGGGGVASEAAQRAEEDVNYIMGRTIFPPAWSGPAMTTFVPKRSLGDRVDSARRRIRQWKKDRARRELARMSPAELERLGAANRAREAARREALTPVAKTVDGVYEILQRLLGDVVEPSLWVELINDPRPIADLDGPLGDLVDEMLGAATPVSAVVKFAPGLQPMLKHLSGKHDQKTHGRGTQQSLPGTEGAGPGPAGKFTEWGDRAGEIEYMAGAGMSSDDLNATLNADPDAFDADLVRQEVELEYDWEIDQQVEERMSRTLLMEDEDEVEATRLEYREEAIDQFVDDYGDEVRERMVGETFDSDKAIQEFDEVYGNVYHEGVTKDGRTVALTTEVTEAWGPQGGDNSIDIKGQIVDADTGNYVGRFHRRFEPDGNGGVTVSHELLQIEDEDYQGTGFAKTFNRQAENYYISHGIDTVHVHAALDGGGYAWASQGFDWDYRNHDKSRSNMNRRLDLYEQSVPNIPDNLRRDMGRLRTRLNDLSVTDPDYPTPKEIANLGRIDGVDTWPGKMIMRGSNWYGSKHLTPSGARQSTTERAAASRRRAQDAYESERAPGRGQKTMDRDFLEGALSQATTATTPLFPPIPGVVE